MANEASGSANSYELQTALQVMGDIQEFMQRKHIEDVREIVGSLHKRN